jgi:hypothetical protein
LQYKEIRLKRLHYKALTRVAVVFAGG